MIKLFKMETPKGNLSNNDFVIKNGQKSVIYQHGNDVIATYDFKDKKLFIDCDYCDYASPSLEIYMQQFLGKFAYNKELSKMDFVELVAYCKEHKLIKPLNQQENN